MAAVRRIIHCSLPTVHDGQRCAASDIKQGLITTCVSNLVAVEVNYCLATTERNGAIVLKIPGKAIITRRSVLTKLVINIIFI